MQQHQKSLKIRLTTLVVVLWSNYDNCPDLENPFCGSPGQMTSRLSLPSSLPTLLALSSRPSSSLSRDGDWAGEKYFGLCKEISLPLFWFLITVRWDVDLGERDNTFHDSDKHEAESSQNKRQQPISCQISLLGWFSNIYSHRNGCAHANLLFWISEYQHGKYFTATFIKWICFKVICPCPKGLVNVKIYIELKNLFPRTSF